MTSFFIPSLSRGNVSPSVWDEIFLLHYPLLCVLGLIPELTRRCVCVLFSLLVVTGESVSGVPSLPLLPLESFRRPGVVPTVRGEWLLPLNSLLTSLAGPTRNSTWLGQWRETLLMRIQVLSRLFRGFRFHVLSQVLSCFDDTTLIPEFRLSR